MAERGVLEDGELSHPDEGTPQGGVISPLLANIYLHYVLDAWLEEAVKPRIGGRVFLIRYADDFVLGFTREADARRLLELLPQRFAKYGLTIHPDKTRLVRFRRGLWAATVATRLRRGRSTFWGSPTTGHAPRRAAGWSNGKRQPTGSLGRSGRSPSGAASTATRRCQISTRR